MAEDSPAAQRDLLSSLLPTPRRIRGGGSPLVADSDDSDDEGPRAMSVRSTQKSSGGGGGATPGDRFRSASSAVSAMSSSQRRAFTGRAREVLLAKNAREASREKATLKQHCNALEEKIRLLESTTATASSASSEKMEQLEMEVTHLKAELAEAKQSAYDVSRAAASAAADSVSTEAHDRVRAELNEARYALEAARTAAAAAQVHHEQAVAELSTKMEREREEAVSSAVRDAIKTAAARAAENDEWLQRAIQERTTAANALEREKQSLGARVTELERVVAEGEACLRDMEQGREEQRRRYKRATAAETAGRLAAEATAAALREEVSRLHGVLEKFGHSIKHVAEVETVDCTTSPMPAEWLVRQQYQEELEEEEEGEDTMMMESCASTDATITFGMMRATMTPPGSYVHDDDEVDGDVSSSKRILSMTPVKTPVTSVKAAARAIDAAVVEAVKKTTTTRPPAAAAARAGMMEDSAMGGGTVGMDSVGPASVGSKPIFNKAAATAAPDIAFSFEYTPNSKPAVAAPVFGGFNVDVAGTNNSGGGGVSLAAEFASAADVELFTALTTLVQCAFVLVAAAFRAAPRWAFSWSPPHNKAAVSDVTRACINLITGVLVVVLMVFGVMLVAEVTLQLSGQPPRLVVPVRMGGVPPRESLRRIAAAAV